ncbi:MAG TPA: IS110 family transposase [Terracidiphilus sp.]|jgi:transposase
MKKNNIECPKQERKSRKQLSGKLTVGIDLGDRSSRYCILNQDGEVVQTGSVATTKKDLNRVFGALRHSRLALEVGTHSPWVSRHLKALGHEVIVANPRRTRLIAESSNKQDRLDAETLARLARVDPKLLFPIRHRGEEAQADLAVIRVRAALVEARTRAINTARGLTKSFGERLRKCDAHSVNEELAQDLPPVLKAVVAPLLEQARELSARIREHDEALRKIARERYPETALLTAVYGVGVLMALTFMLTLDDPHRFQRSRDVGAYLGMRPRRRQSSGSDPALGISKEGDVYLRRLLVQGAHVILGRHGADSDLRRFAQKLAARGGKGAKKKARVAVARKLAVLLHHLWVTGEVYEPVHRKPAQPVQTAA